MIAHLVSGHVAARRLLDRAENAFFRLTHQNTMQLCGTTFPHDLPVGDQNIWFEEMESELLCRKRAFEMRYLARLVDRRDTCWLVYEPRYFSDVMLVLAMFKRKGVRANVMAVPGDAHWRLSGANRAAILAFLRASMPQHSYEAVDTEGANVACRALSGGAAKCECALFFCEPSADYAHMTRPRALKTLFLRYRAKASPDGTLRGFLANAARDDYFVDGRLSSEHQLLVRRRDGRPWY